MTVVTILMSLSVQMLLAPALSLPARMADVFRVYGNVIRKMIVAMVSDFFPFMNQLGPQKSLRKNI